ncbi:hypothetical protein ACFL34_03650 [Candidatus Sumerlaeota bacterium]
MKKGSSGHEKGLSKKSKRNERRLKNATVLTTGFPPLGPSRGLGQSRLIRRQLRKITIQTCAGKVELETLYGQDRQTGHWRCPLKEQLGLAGRLPLSPLLAKRLCFTATQSLSYDACAQIVPVWGVALNDSMVHRYVQEYGGQLEDQMQQETERILEPTTRQQALAELEDPIGAESDSRLVIMSELISITRSIGSWAALAAG